MRSIRSDEKERILQILSPWHYSVIISHYSSISPYDWLFGIGYWNAYVTCVGDMHYKNFAVSRHEVGFFSDASKLIWI